MRFHHSTRRGRPNRFGGHSGSQALASADLAHSYRPTSTSRWSQLGYCRETNIIFNRRLPVEPPPSTLLNSQPSIFALNLNLKRQLSPQIEQQATVPTATSSSKESGFIDSSSNNKLSSLSASPSPSSRLNAQSEPMASAKGSQALHRINSTTNCTQSTKSVKQTNRSSHATTKQQQLHDQLKRLNFNYEKSSTDYPLSKRLSTSSSGGGKKIKSCSKNDNSSSSLFQETNANNLTSNKHTLDMDVIRDKLIAKVDKHPFWSNKAAKRMELSSCEERNLYIYELISYCERRELEWRYEPYRGGLVSSIPYKRVPDISSAGEQILSPTLINESNLLKTSNGFSKNQSSCLASPITVSSGSASTIVQASRRNSRSSIVPLPSLESTSTYNQSQQSTGNSNNYSTLKTTTTGAGHLYEPVSAIERPIPSSEEVWLIKVPRQQWPTDLFVGHVYATEFPNSSFVKRCHGCQGRGRLKCSSCYGVGYEVCISCSGKGTTKSSSHSSSSFANSASSGSGGNCSRNGRSDYYSRNSTNANYNDDDGAGVDSHRGRNYGEPGGITSSGGGLSAAWTTESCHFCHGAGQKRCWVCAGKSFNYCSACLGSGKLRCYLQLIITWINHRDESLINNSDNIIPKERLRLCSGLLLVDEFGDKLNALNRERIDGATGRLEESNQLHLASKRLLDKHKANYRQERMIKQRHRVTQIECHIVNYEWKQRRGHFVIYGDEKKVYIAKYPFKSICNIT